MKPSHLLVVALLVYIFILRPRPALAASYEVKVGEPVINSRLQPEG